MKMDDSEKAGDPPADWRISRNRAWYMVVLMSLTFGFAELSHFLVGTTSRAMSQELQYGEQSCLRNDSIPAELGGNTTCSYYLDQEACDNVWLNETEEGSFCNWDYNGLGIEYQILAGPSFILAFTIGGLLIGALADRYNRVVILAVCTVIYSVSTIVMGSAQAVWQLIFLRFALAFGESACQPVSSSLVLSIFPKSLHGAALGLVNWGIYLGYALSYPVGNYIPRLNVLGEGWRWAYYLSGLPGLLIAALILLTTRDPRIQLPASSNKSFQQPAAQVSIWSATRAGLRYFFYPSVLLLCLAACIRQTAGFTWGYNAQLYFDTYYPGFDVGLWLFLISLVGGSCGILIGGAVSDRVSKNMGLEARAWVLCATQLAACPFAAGVLLLSPPYSFAALLTSYFFSETWFGVLFAILIELAPASVCSFVIAIFLFVMNNVGGNLPIVISPLSKQIGYRESLLIFYPGFFFLSAVLFGCLALAVRASRTGRKEQPSS